MANTQIDAIIETIKSAQRELRETVGETREGEVALGEAESQLRAAVASLKAAKEATK